jgi:hypothetical protein
MPLGLPPELASWNAAGHPDQVRLAISLADAEQILAPGIEALDSPLALRLDVGLPDSTPLLDQHDLDNYLHPLTSHLRRSTGRQFVSVWSTKQHAETSYVRVERASPAAEPADGGVLITMTTTASGDGVAYKQQIADQTAGVVELPDGLVSVQLAFVVGPSRNWLNLWKLTVDALGHLLARASRVLGCDRRGGPANASAVRESASGATVAQAGAAQNRHDKSGAV